MKRLLKQYLAHAIVGVVLGLGVFLAVIPLLAGSDAAAACPTCRAYSIANLVDRTSYTAVHGYIEHGDPTIRDGGFSAEAVWIGGETSNYVEVGWRKESGSSAKMYWGYFDSSWHGPYFVGDATTGHDYQIEHKTSDNKWHVTIDGVEKGAVSVGVNSGTISGGGEVTDYSASAHNAMGISGLTNLSYMDNHAGYYSWWGWSNTVVDYQYYLTRLNGPTYWDFQTGGYNP